MITARLNGGLGNQMFQVATTSVLAWDNGDMAAFDLSMTPAFQGNSPKYYRSSIFRRLIKLPIGWRPNYVYKEPSYEYVKIPYIPNMELVGYFSGERYINHRRTEVLNLFKDKETLFDLRIKYRSDLAHSVSLHVRRGDYLQFKNVYILLGEEYYKKALRIIDALAEIKNILVFSDDIAWCEENLHDPRMKYIRTDADYLDMYLMSSCTHNIMANSSFSWWGAYLNENPEKIVLSPQRWFGDGGPKSACHLFCNDWIII